MNACSGRHAARRRLSPAKRRMAASLISPAAAAARASGEHLLQAKHLDRVGGVCLQRESVAGACTVAGVHTYLSVPRMRECVTQRRRVRESLPAQPGRALPPAHRIGAPASLSCAPPPQAHRDRARFLRPEPQLVPAAAAGSFRPCQHGSTAGRQSACRVSTGKVGCGGRTVTPHPPITCACICAAPALLAPAASFVL